MQKHTLNRLSAAVLFALAATASASTQIPLTIDDARRVAEESQRASVEIGARTVEANGSSTTDFRAWNGSAEQKASIDMDVNLQGGTAAEGWSIKGRDLGTEIPELTFGYDKAGSFEVEGGYQRFTHATNVEGKALGGSGAYDPKTNNLNELGVYEHSFGIQRDVYRVGGRWLPTENLQLRADYQLDERDGDQSTMVRQMKRDYVTKVDDMHHQVTASAEWSRDNFSIEANYYLSRYENSNPWFGVKNASGLLNGTTIDPSNTLHRIGLDALWQISDTSTLSVAAGYAWNKLDDNPVTFANVQNDIPRDLAFDIETKIPTFDVAYTARPLQDLSVSAKYGYRKYDNSADAVFDSPDDKYYFHDQSRTEHRLSADAIYNFGKGYSVKGWGSMLDKDYASVIEGTTEWKGGIELRKRMSAMLSGKLGYQYTDRTAEDWRIWGGKLTNDPYSAKSSWSPWSHAAYDEHALKADLFTNPTDALSLGFNGSIYTRDYRSAHDLHTGLESSKGFRFGFDADLAVSRDVSLFSFYSYDRLKLGNNQGTSVENGVPLIKDTQDDAHTIGLGFDLHPQLQPWAFKLQYVYSFEKTEPSNADDVEYKVHYAEASGSWKLSKDWTLLGSALYGKADSNDYRYTGIFNPSDNFTDLRESANYSAALFYVGVKYDLPM